MLIYCFKIFSPYYDCAVDSESMQYKLLIFHSLMVQKKSVLSLDERNSNILLYDCSILQKFYKLNS